MSTEPLGSGVPAYSVVGERVEVRSPAQADEAAYVEAVTRSAKRLSDFAEPDPDNFPMILANQSRSYRTFHIWALDPEGDHGLVGRVNVANITGGRFRSATIGYDSYDPYAGRGLFVEGLRLTIDTVFDDEPHGLGLHRIEANIQPANTRSAGLVRSLGFVHEGFSRDFLYLPGPDGRRDWRDHDRYTMLSTSWPAAPYRHEGHHRMAVVVNGAPSLDFAGLATHLAVELGLPLYSSQVVSPATLFELLRESPIGGVVEGKFNPAELRMGLARARFDPAQVPVLPAARDVSKRDVTVSALRVRAAFA